MGLKKKFFMLAGVAGLFMAVISIIGFYTAYSNLSESVNHEFTAVVAARTGELDGWMQSKTTSALHAASSLENVANLNDFGRLQEVLGVASQDKEILDVSYGDENGRMIGHHDGDLSAELDPRTRDWYKQAKNAAQGELIVTEAYPDNTTGKMVVTATVPVKQNNQFMGAICADITLNTLTDHINEVNYRGEGFGFLVEKSGLILAAGEPNMDGKSIHDVEGINKYFDRMVEKKNGFFSLDTPAGTKVVAYATMPTTGWILGLSVPESVVYASVNKIMITYSILTIIGIVLIVLICLRFSTGIVNSVLELEEHADQMSRGNLHLDDIKIVSDDEIGSLSRSFNAMSANLRSLITKMASTSEQVAASSEELTANAAQSADSSVHVAETVGDVSNNMEKQVEAINTSKREVDTVFTDVTNMADKSQSVSKASSDTAAAAQKGARLMEDAIERMGSIEESVMTSANMVKKLGENSQEIGQIVEAISSIADQTNLLALNAAIEAARAGEAGRGFAVVAEEVRKLAAESQTSAEEIKARITSIQNNTQQTVTAMEKGTNEVVHGTKAIRDVGVQFQEILTMVDNIQTQMQEINVSVQTVSAGAENIVQAVDQIDDISNKTAENTRVISGETQQQSASNEEIAAASQSLANLAMEMQEAIGKFHV